MGWDCKHSGPLKQWSQKMSLLVWAHNSPTDRHLGGFFIMAFGHDDPILLTSRPGVCCSII